MNKNVIQQDYNVSVEHRRKQNKHNSLLIWFTGLSGSGKSTLANQVEVALHEQGLRTYVLDGDNIRRGLNTDLDFTPEGRKENLRRIAEAAKLFIDAGVVTLAAFISPLQKDREKIKQIVGKENFIEIYVKASVEACEKRDVKGLYQKARNGEIKNFTGISAPYEEPENPDVIVNSEKETIAESIQIIMDQIKTKLELPSHE
ncbi:adenylyl-sulfate kinase [Mesonia mobilis]|uniref:Adenylyl-sulfate kinase n=1 Tax=Mesonia mobilis TaxID=369791 RepID=A0ABQ3BX75_9FLAO|nr:adenylyl-sulfate kinase [Mesonia mobilis]MBQ0737121.1 adenylyl-sulfate kinase [Aquimarina celericrescens]GGZ60339.1 adenylyl-sulfate kinase [Mesonia mobilis]